MFCLFGCEKLKKSSFICLYSFFYSFFLRLALNEKRAVSASVIGYWFTTGFKCLVSLKDKDKISLLTKSTL